MDKYQIIDVPNWGQVRFPQDMSDEEIIKTIKKNSLSYKKPKPWEKYQADYKTRLEDAIIKAHDAGDTEAAQMLADELNKWKPKGNQSISQIQPAKPWKRYSLEVDSLPTNPTDSMSGTEKLLAGIGKGIADLGRGGGQIIRDGIELISPKSKGLGDYITGGKGEGFANALGLPTEADIKRARELDAPLMNTTLGKVGNVVGQVVPSMLIPGVNSYAGAAAVGGLLGTLQPTLDEESRFLNTGIGIIGGASGQKLGNVIGSSISKRVANNTLLKAQNATKDETVRQLQETGFKLPRSLYNPTFKSNMIESFGGKAATLQQASAKNQEVVNSLTRKALDLPDNTPLSMAAIDKVRLQAYKPYQELASISKGAKNALEQLKQAKADANAWFNSYNRSANPEHLAKAKDFQEVADIAEQVIEDYARQAGKNSLVSQLKESRKMIAKTYTVERAMNKGTGDIDARVLGRLFDKGKPLSDGLDDIGRFSASFPKAAQPTQQSAGAGISALEPLSSAVYGAAGHMTTGSPTGMLAAGIPMLRSPARALALSRFMQSNPTYGGGLLSTANKVSPLLPYVGARAGGSLSTNSY